MKRLLAFGASHLIAGMVYSQAIMLDTVTVTASLRPQSSSKTGRNILTISGDYFQGLPVCSLDEFLRYLPGLEVQSRGARGTQSDIIIRGATFQQVLVLLDGLRINDPITGHFTSYLPVVPSEIDHIEILKGATSGLYGSEAVGGVIQIFSKTFVRKKSKESSDASVQLATGSSGFLQEDLGFFMSKGRSLLSGGFLSNSCDGSALRGINSFFHNNTASLSLRHSFSSRWDLSLRASYDSRRFAAQNYYTTFLSDTAREKVQSFWNQVSLRYHKGRSVLVFDAGFKAFRDEYQYNASSASNINRSRLFQSNLRWEQHLRAGMDLTCGLQTLTGAIRSNDRGNHDRGGLAGYALLHYQLLRNLYINPSLRLDHISTRKLRVIPQFSASYLLTSRISIRVSAGTTIRDADFTERYNNYQKPFVTGGSIGNPDLRPEASFSYEGGFDYRMGGFGKISATLFRRDQQDLIDWAPTPYDQMPRQTNLSPTGNFALASNVARLHATGMELDYQFFHLWCEHRSLWVAWGFTWVHDKSSDSITSFYLSSHARLLSTMSVQYHWSGFGIGLTGVYKERKEGDAPGINANISGQYIVINAKASWLLSNLGIRFFVQLDNLFDRRYSDLLGARMPSRSILLGVGWELPGTNY